MTGGPSNYAGHDLIGGNRMRGARNRVGGAESAVAEPHITSRTDTQFITDQQKGSIDTMKSPDEGTKDSF